MDSLTLINSAGNGANRPKIGVIGAGVVGGIIISYFKDRGLSVVAYDKYREVDPIQDVCRADIVFICVPTPYIEGRGLDHSAVAESIALLDSPTTVVIKSTILPGTTEALSEEFPQHHILFQPEFLREKTAAEDFVNPDRQIVGYSRPEDEALAGEILDLLPRAPFEAVVTSTEAEMIKVATNSFLALKVIFANELFDLCGALEIDYEAVKTGLYADTRVGASHFDVFDGGYRGFGGKCLPKDSSGLLDLAEQAGTPLQILSAAQRVNERLSVETMADAA